MNPLVQLPDVLYFIHMKKLLLLLLILPFIPGIAQKKAQEVAPDPIQSKVTGLKHFPGYFDFYHDQAQDKILVVVDKLDQEFLYVNSLSTGIGSNDIGLDRGQLGDQRIVYFSKRGPKILMIQPNYGFRANSVNEAERNAVRESFAVSVLGGFQIVAESNGKFLIDVTEFLLQDTHGVAQTLKNTQQGSYQLDKSKSALNPERIRNFPMNSEFDVLLTFGGQPAGDYIEQVTPTPSLVSVHQHHSFIKLPDPGYKPRVFDPRAGYFGRSYYDYATPIASTLEKKFISRHRLEKKNPGAAKSEAIKPIVYYLDPGTPEPIRSALLDGARWWNEAFEAAGYVDAFKVEILPEGADPMDVRYNVIQWIHRSTRGWSYGATVTDPRTGEIIKGHVSLGSLRVRQDYLIAEGLLAPYADNNRSNDPMLEMSLARLRQLSAHEVGHTLGLAHAYTSSSEHRASVMDYPHPLIKITNGKIDLSDAYATGIGVFDKYAIRYGYTEFPANVSEGEELHRIIQEGLKNGYTFLSDTDARPQGSAHPFNHLWDNGVNAAEELEHLLQVRALVLQNFGTANLKPGEPLAKLEEVLVPMYLLHRYQVEATSKVIGGLNYRYAFPGDGQPVTELVLPEKQDQALKALLKTLDPAVLRIPEKVLALIPPRPLDYDPHRELFSKRTGLPFDALSPAESAAGMTIRMILNPARLNRLAEYHAIEPRQPGIDGIIRPMIQQLFKQSPQPGYNGAIQQTVQYVFLRQLVVTSKNKDLSPVAASRMLAMVEEVKSTIRSKTAVGIPEEWRSYNVWLLNVMTEMDKNPESKIADQGLNPPPGQPIGTDFMECGSN